MSRDCKITSSQGKGNLGKFTDMNPGIIAAGLPTAQANVSAGDALQHYLLKDEVDALISDAVIPSPKPQPRPSILRPIPKDLRHAGPFGQMEQLNSPCTSKFQYLVDDLKETAYKSYWVKPLGAVRDSLPMLPEGFDTVGTTFGIATKHDEHLYDIVTPKVPFPDKTSHSKEAGTCSVNRRYCSPPFKPDLTYGYRSNVDQEGNCARCCLTDERVLNGTGDRAIISTIHSNFLDTHQSKLGAVLAPNDNIKDVPKGLLINLI